MGVVADRGVVVAVGTGRWSGVARPRTTREHGTLHEIVSLDCQSRENASWVRSSAVPQSFVRASTNRKTSSQCRANARSKRRSAGSVIAISIPTCKSRRRVPQRTNVPPDRRAIVDAREAAAGHQAPRRGDRCRRRAGRFLHTAREQGNDAPPGRNGAPDASAAPDFIAVAGPDGGIAGYVPKASFFPDASAANGRPGPTDVPVYGEDLRTLVGHMVAGRGFVPLGVDPLTVATFRAQTAPSPIAAPTGSTDVTLYVRDPYRRAGVVRRPRRRGSRLWQRPWRRLFPPGRRRGTGHVRPGARRRRSPALAGPLRAHPGRRAAGPLGRHRCRRVDQPGRRRPCLVARRAPGLLSREETGAPGSG